MKTVLALFENYESADAVVQELHNQGFGSKDISVVASERVLVKRVDPVGQGMTQGATAGAAVGGLSGLLVGIGALTIPGVGMALVAGSLAATVTATATGAGIGAVGGGLLGALAGWNVPEEEAAVYAEGVKRGGILVAVHTDEETAPQVMDIFQAGQAIDIQALGEELRSSGWSRYDETTTPDENYPTLSSSATVGNAHQKALNDSVQSRQP